MAKRRKGRAPNGSDVKKTNKKNNKLAKRGKLKKKDRKLVGTWYRTQSAKKRRIQEQDMYVELEEQRRKKEALSDDEDDGEDALPLDMVDSDNELVDDGVNSTGIRPKRQRLNSDEYEEKPRSFESAEHGRMKHLLPIKNKDGRIVPQSVMVKEEIAEEDQIDSPSSSHAENGQNATIEDNEEKEEPLSTVELYLKREKLLTDYKEKIASLCFAAIENPEGKVQELKNILSLASGESVPVVVRCTIQKLAIASMGEVFVDIIPGYKIRVLTDAEKQQQMKKETRQLAVFEEALLRYYKKYLQILEKVCQKLPRNVSHSSEGSIRRRVILGKLSVQSLSKLLVSHPHFNFRSNIIVVLAPLMSHSSDEIREAACSAIEQLFKADQAGEATLDAVKSICRFVKENQKAVHGRMLGTLLHLRIKEVEKKDANGKSKKDLMMAKKKRMILVSRKEKKMQKRLKCLEKELQEVELEENTNTILKMHTNVMNQVFATYFRILRRSPTSKLLPEVLAGLSKFAHLINLELVDDLVISLRQLVDSEDLKPLEKLHCIRTALVILSGEGQALTIDPYRFYVNLYGLLPKLLQETSRAFQLKQFSVAFECLDFMINRRRRQVSLGRVAAFTKRLCQLCLVMAEPECAASLLAVRSFFIAHPQLEGMLDEEQSVGGAYRPDIDDPEHSNALGSTIIRELELLQSHSNDTIRLLASYLRYKLPPQGRHRLPADLLSTTPSDLLKKMSKESTSTTAASVNRRTALKSRLKNVCKASDGSVVEEFASTIALVMKLP